VTLGEGEWSLHAPGQETLVSIGKTTRPSEYLTPFHEVR